VEVNIAYRLAGKSVFVLEDHRLGIRLETSFNGKYYESYYVILNYNDNHAEKLSIFKHTIPYFIPHENILKHYLNKNIKVYIDELSDYLHAYVSRREQFNEVKLKYGDKLNDIYTNGACDLIKFKYKHNLAEPICYTVDLIFEDPKSFLAKKAIAYVTELRTKIPNKKKLMALEMHFIDKPIMDAFDSLGMVLENAE